MSISAKIVAAIGVALLSAGLCIPWHFGGYQLVDWTRGCLNAGKENEPRFWSGYVLDMAAAVGCAAVLADATVLLRDVYVSEDAVFLHYAPNTAWGAALNISRSFTLAEMPASVLWRAGDSAQEYRYWSGPVSVFGPVLSQAVVPLTSAAPADGSVVRHGLWLSDANVTATLHYDTYYNIFAQLIGRKNVTVCSPAGLQASLLFPSLHPSYRQAQVALDVAQFSAFLHEKRHGCNTWTLSPGDVLHIPPFFLHHTVALDKSASLNSWLADPVLEAGEDIFRTPVPIEMAWDRRRIVVALQFYIQVLLDRLLMDGDDQTYFGTQFLQRFQFLEAAAAHLPRETSDEELEMWCCSSMAHAGADDNVGRDSRADQLRATQRADVLAQKFHAIFDTASAEMRAIQSVFASDLMEEMIAFFVGIPETISFVKKCVMK